MPVHNFILSRIWIKRGLQATVRLSGILPGEIISDQWKNVPLDLTIQVSKSSILTLKCSR